MKPRAPRPSPTRRGFLIGVAGALTSACFADFTLGRATGELIFDSPGGTIEVLSMEVRAVDLQLSGTSPSGSIDLVEPGPWAIDPVVGSQESDPPTVEFVAGTWEDLMASVACSPEPSGTPAILLEARFRPDDGGPTVDLRLVVDDRLELGADRPGSTSYGSGRVFDLVTLLHPGRWFPNINVQELAPNAEGWVEFRATTNAAIYGQLVGALERAAREWLDP